MNTRVTGMGVSYDHTKKEDKHFFGGFLNLAQDNITAVIKAFCIKFDKNPMSSVQFAESCFTDKDSDTDFQNKVRYVRTHLPVIGYLNYGGDRNTFRQKLSTLLKAVDSLRNFYTHYYHSPLALSTELFELLDTVFASVAVEVKQHKMKDDKTRQLLSKSLAEELDIRYKQQLERLKELKEQGKNIDLRDEAGIRNGVLNAAFNHLIYKEGEIAKPTLSYSSFYYGADSAENGITISQSGLLFLLSMFLGKKEIEDLKSRIRGFKAKIVRDGEENISGLKFMATHWIFSYLSFKGMKQRLSTDFHEETLLIQIIDELSKVPDEVYHDFDTATREKFVEDINEYIREGNEDFSLGDSTIIHPVIRKRYENKFNYFAVRFLDEFIKFPSLRFQVHLGNFVHDRRIKDIHGTGFQTERVVKDRIKVFGKLSEISSLKTEYIEKELDLDSDTGWEIFPNPSYVFIDNNIPIYISTNKTFKNGSSEFIKLRRKEKPEEMKMRGEDKKEKRDIASMIGNAGSLNSKTPLAMLSLNEMPALLYEILVKKTTPEEIELIIKEKLDSHFENIKNYDPEKPLPASQISKRLRNNTTDKGKKVINPEKLIHLINKEIDATEAKFALLAKNRKELKEKFRGKPLRQTIFSNMELGREATWLADDIKRFMPDILRKNWKGYQHNQLQQSLAFFNSRPKEAFTILQDGWDFADGSSFWNGWIINSFVKNRSFEYFYEAYFEGRKEYFSSLAENIKQHTSNHRNLRRFIDQQMPKGLFENRHYLLENLETEKNKILSKPLVFPRGLFDTKPTFIKGIKVDEQPELFAEWYQYGYSTEHVFQNFYGWERDYNDLLESELEKDNDFSKNSIHYSRTSQLELIKLKQDLKIKKIKIQDLFLKLIAGHIFENIFKYPASFSLDELYLTQEERLNKEQEALIQSQRKEGDHSDNIIKDNFIGSKTVTYESKQISEPNVKLKDIGKFNRFLLDDKVKTLLSYNEDKVWNKNDLDLELSIGENSYEVIRREKLFKKIQNFELQTLTDWPWNGTDHPEEFGTTDNKGVNHPNFKMYVVNGILRKHTDWFKEGEDNWLENLNETHFKNLSFQELETKSKSIQTAFLIIMIRNQFAHNQLPAVQFFEFIQKKYPEIQGSTTSELYLNFINLAVVELLELLEK
ncbi:hypothetical protein SAMN05444360_11366 [Chryseobacterium carnipullorum]|uniref:type VI-B CRISPR-associated RNA-guided ribonuclease Cas13b n=1 Tax=Chryseobacterium carnipullorum TaxID=1124835 RepID=UPI00092256BA|nr:type VI-B CRISPR-associated RNA-guided ribonuclease Cas13b [Chryseobacterium carnipullorum]SHM52812.1 hypothetical protein SAMN05444360_11366 [Chryseobacterium carnipullorum]